MRHSTLLSCALSLLLIPAFATQAGTGEEGEAMKKKEEHYNQWFQKLDKDGDGKISREEFQEAMEEKFDRVDADNDGYITQEEWKAAKQKKMEQMKEHHRRMKERHGEGAGGGEKHDMEGM